MWASGLPRDGESVLAGINPGNYNGNIDTDLSAPLPPAPPNAALTELDRKIAELRAKQQAARQAGSAPNAIDQQALNDLRVEQGALARAQKETDLLQYQRDWAARVGQNGKVTGVFTDYHYYGTGDTGGAPREESIKRLEAIVTKGRVSLPADGAMRGLPEFGSGACR